MRWGSKYDAFMVNKAEAEFLEGTTASGKTTVGLYKFILEVANSKKHHHIISALDKGVIEKNIINKDHGIAEEWENVCEYYGSGRGNDGMAHILVHAPDEDKVVYCLGYNDKAKWKKALGGQYGCLYIDEINIADIEFVREAVMRSDYVMGTLNPDDPSLPIYEEYINHSRPIDEWTHETPKELLDMLTGEPREGWVHWYFNMDDNIALDVEKKERIIRNVPEGTKLWKNKILGLRGRATGLVFPNFSDKNIVKAKAVREAVKDGRIQFRRFVMGVDTSYSSGSADSIAMCFLGITKSGDLYVLEERIYNNAERQIPLAPSDVVREMVAFGDYCRIEWGAFRQIFIDSADQATITEAEKYKRENGSIYQFTPAYKGVQVLDRINLQLGWIAKGQFFVLEHCKECLREIWVYSWLEDKNVPEDRNDHTVNAIQYGWMPYMNEIGIDKE